jgi:hypothetical protein
MWRRGDSRGASLLRQRDHKQRRKETLEIEVLFLIFNEYKIANEGLLGLRIGVGLIEIEWDMVEAIKSWSLG